MAFNGNGGRINQTGTNLNLNGIVQTTSLANGDITVHRATRQLRVEGDLTINGEENSFFTTNNGGILVVNGATLRLGVAETVNGAIRRSIGETIRTSSNTNGAIRVQNGGTLIIEGGEIYSQSQILFDGGSTVIINGGVIASTSGQSERIRCSGVITINGGSTQDDMRFDFLTGATVTLNALSPNYMTFGGFQTLSSVSGVTGQFIERFQSIGTTYAGDAFSGALVGFVNPITTEEDRLVLTHNNTLGDRNTSPVIQRVSFNTLDIDGNNAVVRLHKADVDNGNRPALAPAYNGGGTLAVDPRQDIVYDETSVNGEIPVFDFYTRFLTGGQSSGGIYGGTNGNWPASQFTQVDYRTDSNDDTDTAILPFYGYGFLVNNLEVRLQGGGDSLETNVNMLPNPTIVLATKAEADALTTISNANEFNDAFASFLQDNFDSYKEFIVTRAGDLIEAGDSNIQLNATGAVRDFDGTTITVNAPSFAGALETTGTATDNTGTGLVQYSVTGDLIINDASIEWTIDGASVGNIINADNGNNLVINAINGASVSTSEAGTGNGQVSIQNIRTFTLTGVSGASKIYLQNRDLLETDPNYELDSALATGGDYVYQYDYTTDINIVVKVVSLNGQYRELDTTLTNESASIPISQGIDRNYENN